MSGPEAREWARAIGAPVVVAIVVGMASAYLTAQATLAVLDERMTAAEERINHIDARTLDTRERLIRLETKIDVLISSQVRP